MNPNNLSRIAGLGLVAALASSSCAVNADSTLGEDDFDIGANGVHVYRTTAQGFIHQVTPVTFSTTVRSLPTIDVDDTQRFQQVEGFGASMTDSSAWLLTHELSVPEREAAMQSLFDRHHGIGLNILRQPIGASDETRNGHYSYDDLPAGERDPALHHFSIRHDEEYIIPMLHRALAINNQVRILATPWSPPAWMKTNDSMLNGGNSGWLRGDSYGSFAEYIVKFLEAYRSQGIDVFAITPQNEPEQATDYPGMNLTEHAEAGFVTDYLHPALRRAGLDGSVQILGYDYNFAAPERGGQPGYPFALLDDGRVRSVMGGIAFHCYGGDAAWMTALHDQHPDRDIYVTECTSSTHLPGGDRHGQAIEQLIASMRNWARTFVAWNVALGPHGEPHQGNGCNDCIGVIEVDNGHWHPTRDFANLGHASRFVQRGAYRVQSNTFSGPRDVHNASEHGGLEDVAFLNPDGSRVLVVFNSADARETFQVRWHGTAFAYTLEGRTSVTFTWTP